MNKQLCPTLGVLCMYVMWLILRIKFKEYWVKFSTHIVYVICKHKHQLSLIELSSILTILKIRSETDYIKSIGLSSELL